MPFTFALKAKNAEATAIIRIAIHEGNSGIEGEGDVLGEGLEEGGDVGVAVGVGVDCGAVMSNWLIKGL